MPAEAEVDGCTILVVDDDPSVTRMVSRVLGRGYVVRQCNDSRAAIDAIGRGERFDLILCDVRMPGVSGSEFFEAVRATSPELAERIVFMTGDDALMVLPSRRLAKPFSLDELRSVVADHLRVSGRWKAGEP